MNGAAKEGGLAKFRRTPPGSNLRYENGLKLRRETHSSSSESWTASFRNVM